MLTDVTKKLFTVDEFYRMAEAGIFTEDDRVELIDGANSRGDFPRVSLRWLCT